jgi:hypothetical protein
MKTIATTIKGKKEFVIENFYKLTDNKFKGEYPTESRKRGTAFTTSDNIYYRWYFIIDNRCYNYISTQEY